MTSAIFDFEAIGHRLAQMRGEAPNGRVFERNRHSGKYHDYSSTHDFCLGPTQACSRCAATYEEVLDHVAPKACPGSTEAWAAWHKVNVAERGGHPRPRPTNWRMTQHLAALNASKLRAAPYSAVHQLVEAMCRRELSTEEVTAITEVMVEKSARVNAYEAFDKLTNGAD